jgi:hypothetical protein
LEGDVSKTEAGVGKKVSETRMALNFVQNLFAAPIEVLGSFIPYELYSSFGPVLLGTGFGI